MTDGLAIAGSAGVGAAWGWLLGWLRALPRNVAAAIAATVLPGAGAWFFAGAAGVLAFAAAVLAALLLHLAAREGWRRTSTAADPPRRVR